MKTFYFILSLFVLISCSHTNNGRGPAAETSEGDRSSTGSSDQGISTKNIELNKARNMFQEELYQLRRLIPGAEVSEWEIPTITLVEKPGNILNSTLAVIDGKVRE